MIDACVKHLGRLPSQLELTDHQIAELLAYHRIGKQGNNVCPDCIDEDRAREKECFFCKSTFSDKNGVMGRGATGKKRKLDDNSSAIVSWLKDKGEAKLKDAPKEVQEAKQKEWMEQLRRSGVKILE